MEEVRITKVCKGVLLETKAEIAHTLTFPITIYEYEGWTVKKTDRKKWIYLAHGVEEYSTDTLDHQKDKPVGPRAD